VLCVVCACYVLGVALLVVLIPIQGFLQISLSKYRSEVNKLTDKRIKLTNEVLQGGYDRTATSRRGRATDRPMGGWQ
jgi:hypothetical protein